MVCIWGSYGRGGSYQVGNVLVDASFIDRYEAQTHPLDPTAKAGLTQLLEFVGADADLSDKRHIAYMLATVRHECAGKWQPIAEFGHGAGKPYGVPVDGKVYYGRGYVQLTWRSNYLVMGTKIGYGSELADNPDLVLQPNISYAIMSYGMQNGSFTGVGLHRFINDAGCDYVNARKIINGLDQAEKIADYAKLFENLL